MPPATSPKKQPNLDAVTTINPDGSRYFLHPADVTGRFTSARRIFGALLLVIYIALPWIPVRGYPALFLDLAQRRFHFFGVTFAVQDAWLLFFVITGLAFALFYITALFGRIWCGWACPYTIFLEQIYRRIERVIDGDATARRKLDAAPWGPVKATKRVLKHGLFLAVSALIAHVFLSYFVSIPGLYDMMRSSPLEHAKAFAVVSFFTGALYFSFAWFREQFCIILCPYGRFQSVLTDDHTLVIGYDEKRGEPRGKVGDAGSGACVDCRRCVQVCPTGIDIRNGLQIECIGCAACVDACDAVMTKLERPTGLVRYDSLHGLKGEKTRWVRPRIAVYSVLLALGLAVMTVSLSQVTAFKVKLVRMTGTPYYVTETSVRNHFQLRIVNKQHETVRFRLVLKDAPAGAVLPGSEAVRELAAMEEELIAAPVEVSRGDYAGPFSFRVALERENGKPIATVPGSFIGPTAAFVHPSQSPIP